MNTRDRLPNPIATRLVRQAARRAPAALGERLEEEWLAELPAQRGAFAQLRFALGCCWAQQVLARDPLWAPSGARAAGGAVAHGAVAAVVAGGGPSRNSRRSAVLLAIIGLHVAVVFAFIFGVTQVHIAAPPKPIDTTIINKAPPTEPPTGRVHVDVGRTKVVEPLTHVQTDIGTIEVPQEKETVAPPHEPTKPVAPVRRVAGGPGAGFPSTADFYPAASLRLEETGAATVQVCVDERGRLSNAPLIAQSSGISRLDEGALALARAGSGRYRAATEDGRPVASCFPIRVRFNLAGGN